MSTQVERHFECADCGDKPVFLHLSDDGRLRCRDCLDEPAPVPTQEPWCPDHGYGCEPQDCPCGHSLRCDCRSIADEH